MEENITHRKTDSLTILIYTADTGSKLNPDISGNTKKTYSITSQSLTQPLDKEEIKKAGLVIIASDADPQEVIPYLEKKSKPYIILTTDDTANETKKIIESLDKALALNLSVKDFVQIHAMGIAIEKISSQLTIFKNGITKISLKKPATPDDGICTMPRERAEEYSHIFDNAKSGLKLMKFVPASGAATRMFKFLNEFLMNYNPEKETINAYINTKKDTSLNVFLAGLDKFPFYSEIMEYLRQNPDYSGWNKNLRYYHFIKTMLTDERFDYANKPKGILPFHQYSSCTATPIYEHLNESAVYASSNDKAHTHFTISEEHLDGFLDAINEVKPKIEEETGIDIGFSFSYQHKETDTIAVNLDNTPFRDEEGRLFFRPGGHGALIENLNKLDADIVFVKNIDNVSYNHTHVISLYKKALAGLLIKLQEQVFTCLHKIDNNELTESDITTILIFIKESLTIDISKDVEKYTTENKIQYIKETLNRPIRICGMVKNEGEPGGGPFWVKDESGKTSLQIVESSQIDLENKKQNEILSQSTHFNPVDLVCGLKNYKGEPFDLTHYVDEATGFIVQKNRMGVDVKSYELPGLWNGAMAGWITIFTEVPLETFNPVKTVNDLLKPAHQPN